MFYNGPGYKAWPFVFQREASFGVNKQQRDNVNHYSDHERTLALLMLERAVLAGLKAENI